MVERCASELACIYAGWQGLDLTITLSFACVQGNYNDDQHQSSQPKNFSITGVLFHTSSPSIFDSKSRATYLQLPKNLQLSFAASRAIV